MIFNTYWFGLFALLAITVYWLLPKANLRLGFLAAACLVFHAHFAGPAGMLPIVILMILTYFAARSRRQLFCNLAMLACVGTLIFYKYALFLFGEIAAVISPRWSDALVTATKGGVPWAPPLAISFFVFEFVHYLYEVKKGGEPIRNPLKFLLFSIFFPTLVAGPIKRYTQFLPALEAGANKVQLEDVAEGFKRIAMGFLKKLLIADNLTLYINYFQPQFDTLSGFSQWILLFYIGLRILFDFSGYSDIAIGLARLLGIRVPENFNWPYLAKNLQEFWQRWHISLSSWIRDYIYIPLGGNRHGTPRKIANGLIAFALCGMWHGPAWHFAVWGIWHGVGLAICSGYRSIPGLGVQMDRIFSREPLFGWVLTQLYVFFGWLIFFYPLDVAFHMARNLLSL